MAAVTEELYQGMEKNSKAFKLLKSMGWKEGQGLGAQKQGITEHVRVKKKFDALGVGAAEQANRLRDWTTGMVSFDSILSGLKEVKAAPRPEESEDEEPSEEQKKPIKQKKSKGKKRQDDAVSMKESVAKKDIEEASKTKLATHVGRYHKRENAKRVRAYSSEDLAAILGSVPGGGNQPSNEPAEEDGPFLREIQAVQEDSEASSSGHLSDDEEKEPQAKRSKLDAKEGGTSAVRSWWMGLFIRAGKMGSIKQELKSKKVESNSKKGFSEMDQENLSVLLKNHATSGHRGLGLGDAPKKVAGARWTGIKTKLCSEEEEEEDKVEDACSEDEEEEEEVGIVVLSAKGKSSSKPSESTIPSQEKSKGSKSKRSLQEGKSPDWIGLALGVFKLESKKVIKQKTLKQKVIQASGLTGEDAGKQILKAIKKSQHFEIQDKSVRLKKEV